MYRNGDHNVSPPLGFDQDDAALREAPILARAEKSRAAHHRSKCATSGGRGAVVRAWNADEDAQQEVIW